MVGGIYMRWTVSRFYTLIAESMQKLAALSNRVLESYSGVGTLRAHVAEEAAGARFGQIEPKLLFASERYRYGGRVFDTSGPVAMLADMLRPERVVALPYPGESWEPSPGVTSWSEWLGPDGGERARRAPPPAPPQGPGRKTATPPLESRNRHSLYRMGIAAHAMALGR